MKALLVLLLLPLQMLSQDLSGVWKGYILSMESRLPYELTISNEDQGLTGYALTVFYVGEKENMGIKSIRLHEKGGNYFLEDGELVFNNYTTPPKRVKLLATLRLTTSDTGMVLRGNFTTRSLDHRSTGEPNYSGYIELYKTDMSKPSILVAKLNELHLLQSLSFVKGNKGKDNAFHERIENNNTSPSPGSKDSAAIVPSTAAGKLNQKEYADPNSMTDSLYVHSRPIQEMIRMENQKPSAVTKTPAVKAGNETIVKKLPPAPVIEPVAAAELSLRKTEVIRNIDVAGDSLYLSLYDNGTIDGDTVSVVLNGRVILPRQRLTANAIKITVPISRNPADSLKLVMYAENLGSIPPNTGLLVVQDGEERYDIRFEGDMKKSSAVVLRHKR